MQLTKETHKTQFKSHHTMYTRTTLNDYFGRLRKIVQNAVKYRNKHQNNLKDSNEKNSP